jgi:hypothetical protein
MLLIFLTITNKYSLSIKDNNQSEDGELCGHLLHKRRRLNNKARLLERVEFTGNRGSFKGNRHRIEVKIRKIILQRLKARKGVFKRKLIKLIIIS